MPDLTIDKLILFLFFVVPGVIAMQVYSLKCPGVKRDWGSSLIEVLTYGAVNLTLWLWWVIPILQTPYKELSGAGLSAAIVVVCFASPVAVALAWYWLRTSLLHTRFGMDHPTPRAWDFYIRNHHEFWAIFHWKNGKMSGGYFGGNSYASTFPHEQEIYVEELYRVDETGVFLEIVENTNGGVFRLSECERVEFLNVKPEVQKNEAEDKRSDGERRSDNGGLPGETDNGTNGECTEQSSRTSERRFLDGSAKEPVQVTKKENLQWKIKISAAVATMWKDTAKRVARLGDRLWTITDEWLSRLNR